MIVLVLIIVTPAAVLLASFLFTVTEDNYGLLYNKPLFVHFYTNLNTLNANQFYVLSEKFSFYQSLSDKKKKYFEHRVATFIAKYEFIGQEDFLITDEVKVLIASTSVMISFGMRNYLFDSFNKIIVYPSEYYSTMNDAYHKGEFNPRMKAVVFSWNDFLEGYEISNDNLNLGIHEFAHVLHLHGLKNDDASAVIFSRVYAQIQKEVNFPANRNRLINSSYFRIYAFTNQFEFLAVILEHYFESPQEFKQEFPQLYTNVSKMLNHKH